MTYVELLQKRRAEARRNLFEALIRTTVTNYEPTVQQIMGEYDEDQAEGTIVQVEVEQAVQGGLRRDVG